MSGNRWRGILAPLSLVLIAAACGGEDPGREEDTLDRLPADTGGDHLALPHAPDDPDAAPYGCYLYLPGGWTGSPVPYPLLVFLHGAGERGDSSEDAAVLDTVLRNGPPRLIDRGDWAPPHPLIVVSPQCHDGSWNADSVRALLEWIGARYPVDRRRIYLTGLSLGGYGTWSYLGRYGNQEDDPLPIAAAAPICGGGNTGQADAMARVPVWAFHGTADGVVDPAGSVALVKAIGALDPEVPPRLTLYGGVGHDSWTRTYDLSGMDEGLTAYADDPAVDPWLVTYAPGLYDWLFSHLSTRR